MRLQSLTLVVLLVLHSSVALAQTSQPSIYIGPQMRDGFVDIDSGIRDSIRDLQNAFRGGDTFRVALDGDDATLVLIVLGRGVVTNGSIGFGTSTAGTGSSFVVPNDRPTLTTVLRVEEYERIMQSEGRTWTAAAEKAIEDVEAWWDANRAAVETRASQPSN